MEVFMKKKIKKRNDPSLFKIIYCILTGKDLDTEDGCTIKLFSMLTSAFLTITGTIMLIMTILFFVTSIVYVSFEVNWTPSEIIFNILACFFLIAIIIISFIFFVLLIGAGREQKKNDKNESVISIFSALISFIALIISLIALFK